MVNEIPKKWNIQLDKIHVICEPCATLVVLVPSNRQPLGPVRTFSGQCPECKKMYSLDLTITRFETGVTGS